MPGLLKTVFHVHTDWSDDGDNSVEQTLEMARARGVDVLTITDHDTIGGALRAASLAGNDLRIIIGEEVSTSGGHMIGLFLREEIPAGLTPRETAERIRRQGGLVFLPHPCNRLFGHGLSRSLDELDGLIDGIEVHNAQNARQVLNRRAAALAERLGLPAVAGSDLHHGDHLDICHQMIRPFDGPADFLAVLRDAKLVTGRQSLGYFMRAVWKGLRPRREAQGAREMRTQAARSLPKPEYGIG